MQPHRVVRAAGPTRSLLDRLCIGVASLCAAPTARARPTLHRPWTVWLVLLVALLNAVQPGPAQGGMEAADANPFVVCTGDGLRSLASMDASDTPGAPEPASFTVHCVLCPCATGYGAPPANGGVHGPGAWTGGVPVASAVQAPSNDGSNVRPQPRAPPLA